MLLDIVSARVALEPQSRYVPLHGNSENTLTIAGATLRRPQGADETEFIYETSGYIKVRIFDKYGELSLYILAGNGDNIAELYDVDLSRKCIKLKDVKKLGLQALIDHTADLADYDIVEGDIIALDTKAAEPAVKQMLGLAKLLDTRYNSFPSQINYGGVTLVHRDPIENSYDYNYVEYSFKTTKIEFSVAFGFINKTTIEIAYDIKGLTNKGKPISIGKSTGIAFKSADDSISAASKFMDEIPDIKAILNTNTANAEKQAIFQFDLKAGRSEQHGDIIEKTTMVNDREAFLKDLNNLLRRYAIRLKK